MENPQKIAVLIDADNTQLPKLEALLRELSTYGRLVIKRAYGNWKKASLKNWESEARRLAIKTEHQFDYAPRKNATDIAMVIDAMDMLHEAMYDAFALVSSDSDFTPLAIRLRESGAYIIGAGEKKTPEAFRNACDDFIFLEYVSTDGVLRERAAPAHPVRTSNGSASDPVDNAGVQGMSHDQEDAGEVSPAQANGASYPDMDAIHDLLRIASEKYQDADGFTNIASAGHFIKRAKPDFTPLAYGFTKLPELLAHFPQRYAMRKTKGKGTVNIIAYKCL